MVSRKRMALLMAAMLAGTMGAPAWAESVTEDVTEAVSEGLATEEGDADSEVVTAIDDDTADDEATLVVDDGDADDEAALPEFVYSGNSAVLECVCAYIRDELAPMYLESDVLIPVPVIFGVDDTDETQVKVYGDFWLYWFAEQDGTLVCVSGGQNPGVMYLEAENEVDPELTEVTESQEAAGEASPELIEVTEGQEAAGEAEVSTEPAEGSEAAESFTYRVVQFDQVTDGSGLEEDIHRICSEAADFGVIDLEGLYMGSAVDKSMLSTYVMKTFIERYVEDNQLDITAYQFEGWDPVELEPVKYAYIGDKLYRDTGEASFLGRCGNMDFALTQTEDGALPQENGQCSFGACDGQYGYMAETVDLYYGDLYHVFEEVPK